MSLPPPCPGWDAPQLSSTHRQTDRRILHIFSFVGWLEDRGRDAPLGFPWDGRVGGEGPESPIPRQGTWGPLRAGVVDEHQGVLSPNLRGEGGGRTEVGI